MTTKTLSARIASALTIFALTIGVLSPIFALPQTAFAADSGFLSPTSTDSPNEWTSPTNAFSSNNVYAVGRDGSSQDDQGFDDFNFGVPTGATINGIEVQVEAKAEDSNGCRINAKIPSNSGGGTISATLTSTSDTTYTFGGAANLWSNSWTVSDFSNANFTLELEIDDASGGNCGVAVDAGYIDMDGDGNFNESGDDGTLGGKNIIDGKVDWNGVGGVTGDDDSPANAFLGYTVIDGRVDITGSNSISNSDDGDLLDQVLIDHVQVKVHYTEGAPDPIEGQNLAITCDAVDISGTTYTISGTWKAYNFPGNSSQYDVAAFSPLGVVVDSSTKDSPDAFVTTQGPSNFVGTNPNKADMEGTWSNVLTFGSAPSYLAASLYHAGVPGNEQSGDSTCTFVLPQCSNGIDDDSDGDTDYPADPGCATAEDNDESDDPSTLGGLVVNKVLVNDNGGTTATTSFSFTIPGVNAGNPIAFEADGSNEFTLDAGAYNVTEVANAAYTTSYSGCNATVTAGATTTCTITNNDVAPSLTLNKIVDNNVSGGTATESDWTLTATGPSTLSGPGAAGTNDVVSGSTFMAGTYTLSESVGPAGYTPGTWSCTNGVTVNGSNEITLAVGQTTVCSVTNTAIAPKLTVTKVVTNDNGGTLGVANFSLLIDLATVLSGVQNILSVGSKIVSEVSVPGYVGTIGGDCAENGAISLVLGDVKTCTITNDDVAPALTLVKSVVGGPDAATAWTLSATGPTPISGTTPVTSDGTFSAGSYSLSETPAGEVSPYYVAGPWVCTGTGTQDGASIALDPGETATCTITNTYTPPVCDDGVDNDADGFTDADDVGCESPTDTSEANESTLALCTDGLDNDGDEQVDLADSDCAAYIPQLTIVKNLVNNSNVSGTKSVTDFSYQINGGSATAFDSDGSVTVPMSVGSYSVTEVAAAGYTTTYSTDCSGELAAGQSKTCTITNDDIATTLTVVKSLTLNSGKTASFGDFSFTLNDSEPYVFDEDGTTTFILAPGTYDVTESAAPGFTTTYSFGESTSCQDITLALGDQVQCTIVNDDLPACSDGLDNDSDGVSDQNDPGCHSDLDPENSESYDPNAQSEGNESTLELCTDGNDNDGDAAIDLADSDCAAYLPTITVKKVIVNDNGGEGTYSSFFFQVNGGEQTNFDSETGETTVTVPAGVYTITEVAASGYTTTYEGCSEIELGANESATCTITNNDVAPVVEPQNGQCNDGIDNEGDTLIDQQDPQCFTNGVYNPTNTEASTPPTGGGGGITGLGGGGGAVLGASTVGEVLGTSCGLYMDKYVRQGKRNNVEQVKKLQEFLNKYMNSGLPITGFYGPLSTAAVQAFQAKHADTILTPWGIATPTGIVYRTTLRQINMIECPDIAEGLPELVEWSKANDPKKPE